MLPAIEAEIISTANSHRQVGLGIKLGGYVGSQAGRLVEVLDRAAGKGNADAVAYAVEGQLLRLPGDDPAAALLESVAVRLLEAGSEPRGSIETFMMSERMPPHVQERQKRLKDKRAAHATETTR